MKGKKLRRSALLSSAVLIGSIFYAGPAVAAACTDGGGTGTATVSGWGGETVKMSSGDLMIGGSTCAASVDTVVFTGSGNLVFDLSGGRFVTEGDEIEYWFQLSAGTGTVVVNGTSGADRVTIGTEGINLDGKTEVEITGTEDVDEDTDIENAGIDSLTVNGLGGNDVLAADGSLSGEAYTAPVTLNGDSGNDLLTGGNANDRLDGDADSDNIEGGLGNDLQNGGPGNDVFDMDREPDGADVINGGENTTNVQDDDRVDYGDRTADVGVTPTRSALEESTALAAGNDGETGEGDDVMNVENLVGGEAEDILDATAHTADDPGITLQGGDGSDTLTGGAANDTLLGGDNPNGTGEEDTLNGAAGNDKLDGGDGDDIENGGDGNDTFNQNASNNGNDVLSGGANADGTDRVNYRGRSECLLITLDGAANDGEDINCNATNDAADDTDNVGADIEKIVTGRDDDFVRGTTGEQIILGSAGDDNLRGLDGDDTLKGGGGSDILGDSGNTGEAGNDSLRGGSGADKLYGGLGNDTLNGGTGRDTCRDSEGTNKRISCP